MAGSYEHCKEDNGSFRFYTIENMGDAYEACEMMFWMIGNLAIKLAMRGAGGADEIIKNADDDYYLHLRQVEAGPAGSRCVGSRRCEIRSAAS